MVLQAGFNPASLAPDIDAWRARFNEIHVDLGTGDATYALRLARQRPDLGVLGVDTCLDHIRGSQRRWPANLALLCCDAATVPPALDGCADLVTVNFPYGRLLRGLLEQDARLLARISALLTAQGSFEMRINASALVDTGHTLASGERALLATCRRMGLHTMRSQCLAPEELRRFPSSWAKRIGFGRDAIAIDVSGCRLPVRPHQTVLASNANGT